MYFYMEMQNSFLFLSFVGRVDRYNHEMDAEDTEDDGEDLLFHSFSSCSPRYSRVYNRGLEPVINDVNMAFLSPYASIPPQVDDSSILTMVTVVNLLPRTSLDVDVIRISLPLW